MPYKSLAQQRYLHAREPEVAEKFDEETPKSAYKKLPEHVHKSKDKNRLKEYTKKHRRAHDASY